MAKAFGASYIAGDKGARPFLPHDFRVSSERIEVTRHAASLRCAPGLVSILRRQHGRWGMTAAQQAHLDALETGDTAVVVTGQQVGLFLGPLYTFYKAATAIAIAKALAAESGCRVVPLFWLQTEDHDLAEIATSYLPQQQEPPLALSISCDPSQRHAVAHHRFGEEITGLLAQMQAELSNLPHAEANLALWQAHYRPGVSPGEAFAGALASLFGDEGLLILEPRTAEIAQLAAPLHQRAVAEAAEIRAALTAQEAALVEAGYQVQIPTRPGACLSFFHPEGPEGPRHRLMQQEGSDFCLAGHDAIYTQAALEASLQTQPMSWSTSALLRPLLQDTLLPTAAYVGGPGEISYFGQLSPLYQHMGRPMPLVLPRARFVLVEASIQTSLQRLGINVEDLDTDDAKMLAHLSLEGTPGPDQESIHALLFAPFAQGIEQLSDEITQLDPGLGKALDKTKQHVASVVEKFAQKVQNARLQRDQQRIQQLDLVRARLLPMGQPQERIFGLPYFLARYGIDECKQAIKGAIQAFAAAQKQVTLPTPGGQNTR